MLAMRSCADSGSKLLAVQEERRGAGHAEGFAVGDVALDPLERGRVVVGLVPGSQIESEVLGEAAKPVVGSHLLLAPLGLGLVHLPVHLLELALPGSRLDGAGGAFGVEVAGQWEVAHHEGHLAGVVLAQLLDSRECRPARLALEVEELHERGFAVGGNVELVTVGPNETFMAIRAGGVGGGGAVLPEPLAALTASKMPATRTKAAAMPIDMRALVLMSDPRFR